MITSGTKLRIFLSGLQAVKSYFRDWGGACDVQYKVTFIFQLIHGLTFVTWQWIFMHIQVHTVNCSHWYIFKQDDCNTMATEIITDHDCMSPSIGFNGEKYRTKGRDTICAKGYLYERMYKDHQFFSRLRIHNHHHHHHLTSPLSPVPFYCPSILFPSPSHSISLLNLHWLLTSYPHSILTLSSSLFSPDSASTIIF